MPSARIFDHPMADEFLQAYCREASLTFLLGSTPWDIDEAMTEFGFDIGPFELQDQIGLDTIFQHINWGLLDYEQEHWALIPKRMFELGKLGKKTGAGWYRYPGGGGKVEDPIVADLALEEAHFARLQRNEYDTLDIQNRLLAAINQTASRLSASGDPSHASEELNLALKEFGFPSRQRIKLTYESSL